MTYVRITWRCPDCNHRWSLYHDWCVACGYHRPVVFTYDTSGDLDAIVIDMVYDSDTRTCTTVECDA